MLLNVTGEGGGEFGLTYSIRPVIEHLTEMLIIIVPIILLQSRVCFISVAAAAVSFSWASQKPNV